MGKVAAVVVLGAVQRGAPAPPPPGARAGQDHQDQRERQVRVSAVRLAQQRRLD